MMNTAQYPSFTKSPGAHILPSGFLSGFILFGALWLVPVLTLIVLASR